MWLPNNLGFSMLKENFLAEQIWSSKAHGSSGQDGDETKE